jgi:hypothetical protein
MNRPAGPAQGRIFMSYRREDTAYPAGWLFDRLTGHFDRGQIFKDIDSIELGDDFVQMITSAVTSCDVLLALIGNEWLTIRDQNGRRRLDNPEDFVRLEIEVALTRNVRVIPILVEGAQMPHSGDLPASIANLVRRQALELSPSRFDSDTQRLLRVLDRTIAEAQEQARRSAAIPAPPRQWHTPPAAMPSHPQAPVPSRPPAAMPSHPQAPMPSQPPAPIPSRPPTGMPSQPPAWDPRMAPRMPWQPPPTAMASHATAAPAPRPANTFFTVLWALLPVLTIGILNPVLAPIPSAYAAIRLRSRRLWLFAALYGFGSLALYIIFDVAITNGWSAASGIFYFLLVALGVVATVHAFKLRRRVFAPPSPHDMAIHGPNAAGRPL